MEKRIKEIYLEYFLLFCVISLLILIIRCLTPILAPPDSWFYTRNDHYHYIKMAENPLRSLNGRAGAPFCYRVFMPFIAWLLPFELIINFQIITYTSLFLTGITLYQIFKDLFSKILAFTGVLLFFCLEWATRFTLYNIWVPDSLAFFFIILCFWAINKSNYKIYAISLFLGVITKEIVLFTIPVFVLSEFLKLEDKSEIQKELLIKWAAVILPSIIIFIILRLLILPFPGSEYSYFELFQKVAIKIRLKSILRFKWRFYFACTLGTWGVILLIFPFFNHKDTLIKWIKLYGIFLLLIYCQLLFATDIQRLLVAGFYPIMLLALSGMKRLNEEKNINEFIFLIISILYFIIQLILSTHVFS